MNTKKWKSIGTVLGETNISEFYFSLKNYKAKKGDIITTESKIPSSEGNVVPVTVWGKISSIESSNGFSTRPSILRLQGLVVKFFALL